MEESWFHRAGFGLMIHWGLYSIVGGEWNGERTPFNGEWAQSHFRIPNKQYEKLAKTFNPIYFNAEEWVKLAKEVGMKYIVITSKHHDGFALYKSDISKYNIYDATPFKRDVIQELSLACKKHGIKFGVYYSQDIDWSDPNGGGYKNVGLNCNGSSWTNDWDFTDNSIKNYDICFERKIKPQIEEILTRYGKIDIMWFDTPKTLSNEQSKELYNMVKKYQPDCLVNTRIGNGFGDYQSAGDNQVDFENEHNLICEVPATLNDTWGYKKYDCNWKTAEDIMKIKNRLNSKGINYLLNVGPDYLGRIPAPAIDILKNLRKVIVY